MGCCFSRPEGPNSPYPGGAPPSGSARAINSPAQPSSSAEEATAASPTTSHHRRRHHNQPLDQHINKPLRLVPWASRNRIWARTTLDREREAFFDTRVTGREEIWQTIHAALEVLQSPADHDAALQENIATAQSILDAAEITLPSGNLANGVYDALGNYYPLPDYVVSDPTSLIDDSREAVQDTKQAVSLDKASDEEEEFEGENLERRREEKGKAVVDMREQMTVKARLSENAEDIKVSIAKTDSVKTLARKILAESGLPASKRIRIAYMGKILKENVSLLDQGFEQEHIVNALVFNR